MKRVLVIGDVIADVYERCAHRKMCPDAPSVPALVRRSIETRAGGAANVALNLAALSQNSRISLIGELDASLARTIKYTSKNQVDLGYVQMSDEVMLTKRRVYDGDKLVVRLDRADHVTEYTSELVEHQLKSYLAENDPDLILLSDYGHGTVSEKTLQLLLNYRDRLMVDTKMTSLEAFDGTLLCKLNRDEWSRAIQSDSAPERWFKYMVVTIGELGARLYARREIDTSQSRTDTATIHGFKVPVVDVCGCGDTFLAGLASSMLLNGDPFTAVLFANAAAATVVSQNGTAVADRVEAQRLSGLWMENERETR